MRCFDASLYRLKFLAAIVVLSGSFLSTEAQQQIPPVSHPAPGSPTQAPNSSDDNDQDPMTHHAMVEMAEKRNEQRQQDIVKDTARLLVLAQELKADVDKSTKYQMSLPVIKKAEEIEKLAKSVKEKMKGS